MGERLAWYKLASHLRAPVTEIQGRMSFGEFLGWMAFLEREEERHTKQDRYLAQIAAEVRRSIVKHPNKVKNEDFLMRVRGGEEGHVKRSKEAWLKALGIEGGNN